MAPKSGGDGDVRQDDGRDHGQGRDQDHDRGYGDPHDRPRAPKNGAGTVALVLGVLSILLSWVAGLGLVPGVLGLVLAVVGLRRARRGRATNRGSALVGLVTSLVGIVLSLVVAVLLLVLVGTAWNNGGRELLTCVRDSGNSQAAVQQCLDTFDQRVDDIGSVNP